MLHQPDEQTAEWLPAAWRAACVFALQVNPLAGEEWRGRVERLPQYWAWHLFGREPGEWLCSHPLLLPLLRLPLLLYWLLRKPARIVSVMAALGLR